VSGEKLDPRFDLELPILRSSEINPIQQDVRPMKFQWESSRLIYFVVTEVELILKSKKMMMQMVPPDSGCLGPES
jgi:hypothetical protein